MITQTDTKTMYEPKDFKSDQNVRWCPGCGDHAALNSLHKAMAELGLKPHEIAVISGIGCSSRLPYYMNTFGFHTIHGRGIAVATGVKTANPQLSVWVATGDGDGLAIGGNHFIHALRRNVDLNILLLNNKIYGLTKGQYSPTSERGFVSKSSPYGTVEDSFSPAELCFGARGTFFARSIDIDLKNLQASFVAAEKHKGTSVVEVYQNCVIFNDKIHQRVSNAETRADHTVQLLHGEKMLFGKEKEKGIVLDGWTLKAIELDKEGYTIDDVLVHDETTEDSTLHRKLALMNLDDGLPVAMGVIRNVAKPVYDQEVTRQIQEVRAKKPTANLRELLLRGDVWEVK